MDEVYLFFAFWSENAAIYRNDCEFVHATALQTRIDGHVIYRSARKAHAYRRRGCQENITSCGFDRSAPFGVLQMLHRFPAEPKEKPDAADEFNHPLVGALLSHLLIGILAHTTLIEIVAKRASLVLTKLWSMTSLI
ncbi:hypothetical protein KXD40_002142 [Peronospora effusa]|nr:hypothetical protein KXD40_002142 [Peronospora effusa]